MDMETSKGERTRTAILQAAHDLFLEQGYHGTSMRQVAEHAEIALGGIYNHFTGKEEIFEAVLYEYHPLHTIFPYLVQAKGENAQQFFEQTFQCIIANLNEREDFFNLVFIELVEFGGRHFGAVAETIYPQVLPFVQLLAETYAEIRPIPTPLLIRSFLGFLFGYFLTERLAHPVMREQYGKDALKYMLDMFLYGIVVESSEQKKEA